MNCLNILREQLPDCLLMTIDCNVGMALYDPSPKLLQYHIDLHDENSCT